MSKLEELLTWYSDTEDSVEYAAEHAKMDFAVGVERRMKQMNMTRAELARRLGTSAAAVTMSLRGTSNLTIERMVKMAGALDATVHIHLAQKSNRVNWYEIIDGTPAAQLNSATTWAKTQSEASHGQSITVAA
jgi:antitoxin component HigA of HigAB toxin-antitoxin module